MKKSLISCLVCVIFAAVIVIFFPEAELSHTFHLPVSEEQELCIAWSIPGAAGPAYYDPYLHITDHFLSIEFFDYPGEEAWHIFYIGIRSYFEKSSGRTWKRFNIESWYDIDAFGGSFTIVF